MNISANAPWIAVLLVWAASVILASPDGFSGGWGALLVAAACVLWGADNNFTALIDGFTPAAIHGRSKELWRVW